MAIFIIEKYVFNQFSVAAVSGPISPRWKIGKYSLALCNKYNKQLPGKRERERYGKRAKDAR